MTKEEFSALAEEMRGPLYRVACAYLRREADRLDAVQEALLRAWESRHKLRQEEYFKTWLTRIMIRQCVDILRQQKRVFPAESLPESRQEEPSGNPALRDAILALPEGLRIVSCFSTWRAIPPRKSAGSCGRPRAPYAPGYPEPGRCSKKLCGRRRTYETGRLASGLWHAYRLL